jgi:hypothetical protein
LSFATEADNNVSTSTYPMRDTWQPHVAVQLSAFQGPNSKPVLLISRLNPDDARRLGASLTQSADLVQKAYEEFRASKEADGDGFA